MNILDYIKRIQAIAQGGLTYSQSEYDLERYEELRTLSIKMLSKLSNEPIEKVKLAFASEKGYQTPKVDVRAVCIKDSKILLVRERTDNKWSLPGGWCDIGYSPSKMAQKEVLEESGFEVEVEKLLALYDKECHGHPMDIYHVYKLFFLCNIVGGEAKSSVETSEVAFFDFDNLPELSLTRNTYKQIERIYELYKNPGDTDFD
jgi:ADP-ribose pyrophosphatase YjhB (NUDIX family)